MPRKINIKIRGRKYLKKATKGKCPYCNKYINSVEAHIKSNHLNQKLVKRK
ncbi:hypothetical protein J4230_00890 [Candidatus Woesearchaeota archaeon]|nr:hypothetical protein [Candidatus Woesearchaeota archaeon]